MSETHPPTREEVPVNSDASGAAAPLLEDLQTAVSAPESSTTRITISSLLNAEGTSPPHRPEQRVFTANNWASVLDSHVTQLHPAQWSLRNAFNNLDDSRPYTLDHRLSAPITPLYTTGRDQQRESQQSRSYLPRHSLAHDYIPSSLAAPALAQVSEPTSLTVTRPALANEWSHVAYDLFIRQQPLAARACGFGERDRRVIDPPPILELKITDRATKAPRADAEAFFAVSCKLVKAGEDVGEGGLPAADVAPGPSQLPLTHYLMGSTAASPFQGKDEHLVPGTFFVFADLSCRYPGKYKIQFRLLRIDPRMLTLTSDSSHPVVASVETDIFTVYAPKDFPGMRASTALLKALHDQGLYVSLKKGTEAWKRKRTASQRVGATGLSDGSEVDAPEFLDADPTELTGSRTIALGRGKRRRRDS